MLEKLKLIHIFLPLLDPNSLCKYLLNSTTSSLTALGARNLVKSYNWLSVKCEVLLLWLSLISTNNQYSPTLYSQITGKYASVESKIFPHILLLCSISYSSFNGLTINQHFIKPLQGEKCTSYLSVVDLSIVLPRVFFFAALCGRTNLRSRSRARTPTKLLRSTF